ncbi:hypothetical protein FA13DRAFT_1803780 [Coprinellus micaceus]|uniref:Uncharacterized protein n=1 Tax=Coprinellus micaceus TaxID=71717 RepID=A0A4Y7SBX6_COPMI|nr:hypothetical protein FA13DRAFT_1803780 [Coprinellus micaceus]
MTATPTQPFLGPPTTPTTPVSSDRQNILYGYNGIMGGGDFLHRLSSSEGSLTSSPSFLRVPHQHSSAAKRNKEALLGSPIRLHDRGGRPSASSPSRTVRCVSRPLVRAAQALIPLWDYPAPGQCPQVLSSPMEVEDLLAPLGASPMRVESGSDSLPIESNPNTFERSRDIDGLKEDFPTTIALAVLASIDTAVKDAIDSESPTPRISTINAADFEVEPGRFDFVNPLDLEATDSQQNDSQSIAYAEGLAPEHIPPFFASDIDSVWHDSNWALDSPTHAPWSPNAIAPLDISLLEDIPTFNPRRPTHTNFDVLMRLCTQVGREYASGGITKTELKRILRTCVNCQRFMYADRRAMHHCDAPPLDVHIPGFDISQSMLTFDGPSGVHALIENTLLERPLAEWAIHTCPRAAQ